MVVSQLRTLRPGNANLPIGASKDAAACSRTRASANMRRNLRFPKPTRAKAPAIQAFIGDEKLFARIGAQIV